MSRDILGLCHSVGHSVGIGQASCRIGLGPCWQGAAVPPFESRSRTHVSGFRTPPHVETVVTFGLNSLEVVCSASGSGRGCVVPGSAGQSISARSCSGPGSSRRRLVEGRLPRR